MEPNFQIGVGLAAVVSDQVSKYWKKTRNQPEDDDEEGDDEDDAK